MLITFAGLILLETAFVALSTGYMSIQCKSPLFENIGFFMVLAGEAPLATLKMVFVEQPLFIIEAKHRATTTTVWSLHYFSFTILVHFVISLIIAGIILRLGTAVRWQDIPFTGSVLLLFSCLYLLLASCCTGGPNWIFQTWLLSVVFNPLTSSNATISLYQTLKDGFVLLQIITGVMGGYLLFRHLRKTV